MADPYKEEATEKQKEFLKNLGYTGEVKNKAQASSIIDILIKRQQAETLIKIIETSKITEIEPHVKEALATYGLVVKSCVDNKIYDPPVIGMIYNNVMACLRNK